VTDLDLRGNLVSDAALAALALEHGLAVVSADSDFARFPGPTWINSVAP
jgi:predicted nucleic acid-binding protein